MDILGQAFIDQEKKKTHRAEENEEKRNEFARQAPRTTKNRNAKKKG